MKGKLLIAPPALKDEFWSECVILVTTGSHARGHSGLLLNKPSHLTIKNFGDQLGYDLDYPGVVYAGGKSDINNFSLLHSSEWFCASTIKITDELSVTSSLEVLTRFARNDHPIKWKMFMGVCLWGPEQLRDEVIGTHSFSKKLSWCYASSQPKLVFDTRTEELWDISISECGAEFAKKWP